MSLLSLLKEIREIPGIINKIGYLYDNFLSNNGYVDSEIVVQQSELYLAIPEVANNNDFSETANQSEVYAYFQARYPQLNELSSNIYSIDMYFKSYLSANAISISMETSANII